MELAAALVGAIDGLADGAELPGMPEFRRWAEEVAGLGAAGTSVPATSARIGAGGAGRRLKAAVPPGGRDDIAIWGELEARLMSPDLMILAGLNEDIWPPVADPGPWLSRSMRIAVGLEPPERQQGQAAHDFTMAMGNAEVLIAYATRIGTSPALPSPLLQRLDAVDRRDVGKGAPGPRGNAGCARQKRSTMPECRVLRRGRRPAHPPRCDRGGCRSPRSSR
jgi:ATP-dependent helicase/nuclease subunit B